MQRALDRLRRAPARSHTVTSSSPAAAASSTTPASQAWPSYHQWPEQLGVERAGEQARAAALRRVGVQARGARAPRSRARARAPAPARARGSYTPARVVPRAQVVHGAAVVVAVVGMHGVAAAVVPHQLHRLPVDRHGHRARGGEHGLELVGRAVAQRRRLVHAERPHAVVAQVALQARGIGALRQPQPAAPAAEAALVGRDAGGQLQAQPGVAGQQRKHGVRGGGGPQLHVAGIAEPRPAPPSHRGRPPARPARARSRPPPARTSAASSGSPVRVSPASSSACTSLRVSRRNPSRRSPASPGSVSSWSHSTGVTPSVTGASSRPSRSIRGRYTHATASHSHSSPNGQVPKPST